MRDKKSKEIEADVESFIKNEEPSDRKERHVDMHQLTEKEDLLEGNFTQLVKHKMPVEKIPHQKTSTVGIRKQRRFMDKKNALKTNDELKKNRKDKYQSTNETENDDRKVFFDAKEHSTISSASLHYSSAHETLESDPQDYHEHRKKQESSCSNDRDSLSFKDESIEQQQVDYVSENKDKTATENSSNISDEGVEFEQQSNLLPQEENENSYGRNIQDPDTETSPEKNDSSTTFETSLRTETSTSIVTSKPGNSTSKLKTSKGPKIKRTLSRAERLSRTRKAKSGMSFKTSLSLKVSPSTKQQFTPRAASPPKLDAQEVNLPPKVAPPKTGTKTTAKSEKTVQRRRSFKGSRSSSISPRGYGYSMAFMDIEKPLLPDAKPEEKTEIPTTENELTIVTIPTESLTSTPTTPTSPTASTAANENQVAPRKQTYQAKKFRLDQITGKLSAQRQSEAQAAAHSPSAFQLAKHHSSPPPPSALSPSPPANPPPYPRESYPPPPGPPPLIYSPMPGSCCPPPHHQHLYGPHPGHGMHLPPGHMHPPHPEYPPPSSGYMLYAHGMHYPPHGPCIGQCK